jgi:DNA-binding transcriptional regulator of glucitol operon
LTPPWILLHLLAVVLTVGFAMLGWWQLSRAQGGNAISWGYALEWPLFAVFTVALWIRQMRLELRKDKPAPRRKGQRPEPPPVRSPYEASIVEARTDSIPGSPA